MTEALIEDLRDRIAEKDERIRQLLDELGASQPIPRGLGHFSPTEGELLGLLIKRDIVSRETAMVVLYGDCTAPPDDKVIDVFIHHIRRKLVLVGIEVCGRGGQGWFIPPGDKAVIAQIRERERRP